MFVAWSVEAGNRYRLKLARPKFYFLPSILAIFTAYRSPAANTTPVVGPAGQPNGVMGAATKTLVSAVTSPLAARANHTVPAPDIGKYKSKTSATANKAFAYTLIGAGGFFGATSAKAAVVDLVSTMSASADVLALAAIEVDLNSIKEVRKQQRRWRQWWWWRW